MVEQSEQTMSAAYSVFCNDSLVHKVCRYVPSFWDRTRAVDSVLTALRVWASSSSMRRMHFLVHLAHLAQYTEVLHGNPKFRNARKSMRMMSLTRCFFPTDKDDKFKPCKDPYWDEEHNAFFVHIPESVFNMACLNESHLKRYQKLMKLYGIKMNWDRRPREGMILVYLSTSNFEFVRTSYDPVNVQNVWVDSTSYLSSKSLHYPVAVPSYIRYSSVRFYDMTCGFDKRRVDTPVSSLSFRENRKNLGKIVYACSHYGYRGFFDVPYITLYSGIMLDVCYLSMMHAVFSYPGSESELQYWGFIHDKNHIRKSFLKYMDPPDRALYAGERLRADNIYVSQHDDVFFSLCMNASPALCFLSEIMNSATETFRPKCPQYVPYHVDLDNFADILTSARENSYRGIFPRNDWVENVKDLQDFFAYVKENVHAFTRFMNASKRFQCVLYDRTVNISSNQFMLDLIGSCFPRSMMPVPWGECVSPPITSILPCACDSPTYAFAKDVNFSCIDTYSVSHMRKKRRLTGRHAEYLSQMPMSSGDWRLYVTGAVTFVRMRRADPTLRYMLKDL